MGPISDIRSVPQKAEIFHSGNVDVDLFTLKELIIKGKNLKMRNSFSLWVPNIVIM